MRGSADAAFDKYIVVSFVRRALKCVRQAPQAALMSLHEHFQQIGHRVLEAPGCRKRTGVASHPIMIVMKTRRARKKSTRFPCVCVINSLCVLVKSAPPLRCQKS